MKNYNAFTLVELMIIIAITAIATVMFAPNMMTFLQQNQATQQSHDFISTLQLALSEAETNGSNVSLCAKNLGVNTCVTYSTSPATNVWNNGWLLFVDSNNDAVYDPSTDKLIKVQENQKNSVAVTAPSTAITISESSIVTKGAGTFDFKPIKCTAGGGHRVMLTTSAHVTAQGLTCP